MMKEKALTNHTKSEWECLINTNSIYMGDHLTRQWSKSGKDSPHSRRQVLKKNNNIPCSKSVQSLENKHQGNDAQNTTVVQPSKSQYSVRKISNGKRKLKSGKEILLHHHITKEDMLQWQESFDSLLNSPAGRYVFKLFLESEIADENLKFWLACEDLKNSKSKRVKHRVQDIYDTYIDVYSPHEINIDYKMREDIVDQLKYKKDVSVFTETQHQVYTLMHRDSYPRFLASQFAAELTKALMERQEQETKSSKKSKGDGVSKSPPKIISCCYSCRYQDSDPDGDELVEEQATVSTPVFTTAPSTNFSNENKEAPADTEHPKCSKTDSTIQPNSIPAPPGHQPEKASSESKPDSDMKETTQPSAHDASPTISSKIAENTSENLSSDAEKNALKRAETAEMTTEI